MWGDEPQLQSFRERLKVLLEAHQQELNPQRINASDGEVLFRQGEPVDTLLLLTSGRVAVDVHQGDAVHTLVVIEAVELLGEVGFFANGQHYADFRVVDGPAELVTWTAHHSVLPSIARLPHVDPWSVSISTRAISTCKARQIPNKNRTHLYWYGLPAGLSIIWP